eukprot:5180430-Prymnesium_polylepis.1
MAAPINARGPCEPLAAGMQRRRRSHGRFARLRPTPTRHLHYSGRNDYFGRSITWSCARAQAPPGVPPP